MKILHYVIMLIMMFSIIACSSGEKNGDVISIPDSVSDTSYSDLTDTAEQVSSASYEGLSNVADQISTSASALEQEYQKLSRDIDALQSEYKATINTQMVAQDFMYRPDSAYAEKQYHKKMDKLLKIRAKNEAQGLPTGPYITDSSDIKWVVETLKKNFDVLSDRISRMKREKGKVVERQYFNQAK